MDGARTRGQPAALERIAAMVRSRTPHAVLLTGPDGVGKTTLALDLAAGLLCEAELDRRPCRVCRACRMVDRGGHPDVHRLGTVGPGRQVVIGGPESPHRGIRELIMELSLMPVEGRVRVAIIEPADRMTDEAQSALLKTLEEPPAGVVIMLCADREARLFPTVRSRCARVRLGLVGPRDIEAIVADHELADPPLAARLGRLAAGRPGLALALARAPEAVLIRAELSRVLLDLTAAGPAERLAAVRSAIPRAMALLAALGGADSGGSAPGMSRRRGKGVRDLRPAPSGSPMSPKDGTDVAADEENADGPEGPQGRRAPASERRRAAEILIGLWMDVARDLVLAGSGGARSVHDPVLLEELATTAAAVDPEAVARFLDRSARGADLLVANVSPELLLDSLALAWPRPRAA